MFCCDTAIVLFLFEKEKFVFFIDLVNLIGQTFIIFHTNIIIYLIKNLKKEKKSAKYYCKFIFLNNILINYKDNKTNTFYGKSSS